MKSVPFSCTFNSATGSIITDCKVSDEFDVAATPDLPHPEFIAFKAIWDTGAMRSSISTDVVKKLGLKPYGFAKVFHADGVSMQNTYFVNFLLPNGIEVKTLLVTEAKMTDIDVLIGMDVITLCDFALTSSNGMTKFSFQVPSSTDIDFTKEL